MEEYTAEEKIAFNILNMTEKDICDLAARGTANLKGLDEETFNKVVNWIVTAQIQANLLSLLAKGSIEITDFDDEPVFSAKTYASVMNQISDILEENINTKGDL